MSEIFVICPVALLVPHDLMSHRTFLLHAALYNIARQRKCRQYPEDDGTTKKVSILEIGEVKQVITWRQASKAS